MWKMNNKNQTTKYFFKHKDLHSSSNTNALFKLPFIFIVFRKVLYYRGGKIEHTLKKERSKIIYEIIIPYV